jgi:hypothetical protein
MSTAVQEILARIDQLSEKDRALLEQHLAEREEEEWKLAAEQARAEASQRGIDQAAIDRAIDQHRYGK